MDTLRGLLTFKLSNRTKNKNKKTTCRRLSINFFRKTNELDLERLEKIEKELKVRKGTRKTIKLSNENKIKRMRLDRRKEFLKSRTFKIFSRKTFVNEIRYLNSFIREERIELEILTKFSILSRKRLTFLSLFFSGNTTIKSDANSRRGIRRRRNFLEEV